MKNSLAYVLIFISISFFNIINSSGNKIFKEDYNQEEGLIILKKLNNSFNDFEISFNNYQKSIWQDKFNVIPTSRNRIETALGSAELRKKLEEKWNTKDKETIFPKEIQETIWENSKIYLIPYDLTLFERSNPFDLDIKDLEEESYRICQTNSEQLARTMKEKGNGEETEEAKVYFKYEKLKEKRKERLKEKNPKLNYYNDLTYEKYNSNQKDSLRKLKELASTSSIQDLPTVLDYDEIFKNLRDQKLPLFNKLKELQKLAYEMVEIYFN